VVAGGDLGQEFIVGDPGRGGQTGGFADGRADGLGDAGGRGLAHEVVGDVEESFVHGQLFHQGGIAAEQGHDLARHLLVARHARANEHRLRTQLLGAYAGHGRMDAKGPGFVGTGRDHPPAVGRAADNHRQAEQLGPVQLFDRGEKGIHVDVNDFAGGRHAGKAARSRCYLH